MQDRRTLALALMAGVYFFYILDRTAVLITQDLIKAEFQLSDTQLGLMTSLLYAVAFAAAGVPLGRLADRMDRSLLLATILAIWSTMTFLCAFATRFWHLAAARAVLGAAESGGSPTSLSLLSDLYPPEKRATVSSIFFAGAAVGTATSFFFGGYIAEQWGWRAVFLIYGVPGLILAALIRILVKDPRKSGDVQSQADRVDDQGFWAAVAELVLDRALLAIYIGGIFFTMAVSTVGVWLVPYLMRVHDLPVSLAGVIASVGYGVLGIVGSLAFGIAADAAARRRTGGMLELLAIGALINGAATLGLALVSGFLAAMAFLALWGISGYIYAGTANAAISQLAPARSRAMAFALYTVLVTLIGTSVGPLLAGMLSDAYQHEMGDRSLLPGIGLSAFYQVGSTICFVYAARAWRQRTSAPHLGLSLSVVSGAVRLD